MKIMVLSPYLPHAKVGHGGGTAVRDLVTWLAREHQVLLVSLLRPGEAGFIEEVESLGKGDRLRVAAIPYTDNLARGARRLGLAGSRLKAAGRSLTSGYPLYVTKYGTGNIRRQVIRLAEEFQPDAIQIEYLQLALQVRSLRRWRDGLGTGRPRLILNSHELGSVPRERSAARASNPMTRLALLREAAGWRRLQVDASGWADKTLCVTPEDRDLYKAMGGLNLETVPLGMDIQSIKADWFPTDPERYLFVGSFGHRPNVLAAQFLVDKVWPAVSAARPWARLILAGRGSRAWLNGWMSADQQAEKRIEALGFVDDLTPLFRECRLFLAPLPEGGGIKIKILEAMARGIPLVTTPIGAEGICGADDGVAVVVGFGEGFSGAVLEASEDLPGSAERALKARRLMEDSFSWEVIVKRLEVLYG